MLDPILKAKALEAIQNPPEPSPEREARVYAYMTAESLRLEGIETTADEILELVRAQEQQPATP